MLTNEFCVRGKFWEKDPHTHSPPPLSVVGVSNNKYRFGAWLMHLFMVQVEVQVSEGLMHLFMVQVKVHVGALLMHLFMVQVDYRLFGIGWCMFYALVYGTG
jgi:hypothetical protein